MEAADRPHRGRPRRERAGALGEGRGAPRVPRGVDGLLEERRRKNLAGEVFAVASARAKAHLEQAVADDPELRRLLDEVQSRKLDPLTAVREIMEKVFKVGDETGPSLSDIKEARSRLQGVARETPVYGSETLSRQVGRPVSLKAENLQRTGSFKVAAP